MAKTDYVYDWDMVNEMVIIMENNIDFYDAVRTVREMYFADDYKIDPFNLRVFNPEIISHAACYALITFVSIWEEIETRDYITQEYFKACHKAIPELLAMM